MQYFIIFTGIIVFFILLKKLQIEICDLQDQVQSLLHRISTFETMLESFKKRSPNLIDSAESNAKTKENPRIYTSSNPHEIIGTSAANTSPPEYTPIEIQKNQSKVDLKVAPPEIPILHVQEKKVDDQQTHSSILDKIDWEMFMGAKLFAWVGGLLLFIGVCFFVKYSLDHDLIPAEIRASICYLVAVGMIGGGLSLSRNRYPSTVQTLCGTGVLILYGITFASRAYYHFNLFSPLITLGLMVLITVVAFLIALRLDAKTVAVMGILGGFLTPLLISTGENNPAGLFSYIAILDIGLLAVALVQGWGFIAVLGAVGTFLLEAGWASHYFHQSNLNTPLWISLSFNFIFALGAMIAHRINRLSLKIAWATGLTVIANYFFMIMYYHYFKNHPVALFSLAFGASILLLGLTKVQGAMVRWFLIGGGVTFSVLLRWTVQKCDAVDLLDPWVLYGVLGLHFIFAILHTVIPFTFRTFREKNIQGKWALGFSMAALWLALWIPFQSSHNLWIVWGVILLLNLIVSGCALILGSVLAVFIAGISTLCGSGLWILMKPHTSLAEHLLPLLALITGMSVIFFSAGLMLVKRFRLRGENNAAEILPLFSVFSAAWPYLLLSTLAGGIALPNPSATWGVAFLMNILLLGLSRYYFSGWLPGIALAGTTLIQGIWYFKSFTLSSLTVPLLWTLGFHLLFTLFPFYFKRAYFKEAGAWITSALAGPISFVFLYAMTKSLIPETIGGTWPTIFTLTSLIWLIIILKIIPETESIRLTALAWFGGITLLFITLIFPMQFNKHWLTVGWGMEGAALFWFFHRVRHLGLPKTAFSLLIICFGRLLWNAVDSECYTRSEIVFINTYLFDYFSLIGALAAARRFLIPESNLVFNITTKKALEGMGLTLLFVLMNIAISDLFTTRGEALTLSFSGSLAQDMTYTIAWTLFSLGLVFLGLLKKTPYARYTGIGLIGLSLLKLFFHDLVRLNQLYRIAAFIAVAVMMMLVSFFYQKFLRSLDSQ